MAEQAPHSTDVDQDESPACGMATRGTESLFQRAERHHLTRMGKYLVAILVALASAAVTFFDAVPIAREQLAVSERSLALSREALAVNRRSLAVGAAGQLLAACRAHQPPASQCKTAVARAWSVLEAELPSGQ